MLELFEYTSPRGVSISPDRKQADQGFIHVGFTTDRLHDDYNRLLEQGVRFFGEPVEFRPNVWVVYFYGPDGEVCELRQV
jgi:catechol 2,3-dioxygenase-like lactoylglutathione lyase family enzyme